MSLVQTYTGKKLEPFYRPELARQENVKLDVSLTLVKGTVLADKSGANAIHKLTPSVGANLPTGGTGNVVITASGHAVLGTVTITSTNITPQSSAAEIQAAIENGTVSAGTWNKGRIRVTGGPFGSGAPVYIEFVGGYGAGAIAAAVTTFTNNFTGGTPTVTVSLAQTGAAGSPGTYAAHDLSATNGLQVAKRLLTYDCVTDADGNVTLGQQATSEVGDTLLTAPAYYAGHFKKSDLTGFTETARQQLADVGIFIHD